MEFLNYFFAVLFLNEIVSGQNDNHFCGRLNYTTEELVKEPKRNIPWGAFVTKNSYPSAATPCGAIIISPTLLLTQVSNCFYNGKSRHIDVLKRPSSYIAFADSPHFSSATVYGQKLPVSYISVHFHFGRVSQWTDTINDFALVHLSSPIQFSDAVHPICLPDLEINPNLIDRPGLESLVLFGWARGHFSEINGMRFRTLSREECQSFWYRKKLPGNSENRFCAAVVEPNKKGLCVPYDIGSFYLENGQYYFGGQTNNYFSNAGKCSLGATYYFWSLTNETLSWIRNSETCGSSKFTCFMDGKCIPKSKLCDGQLDCKDFSDEREDYCLNRIPCREEEFQCKKYGNCIPKSKVNDGTVDCPGGDDELEKDKDAFVSNTDFNFNYLILGSAAALLITGGILIVLFYKRKSSQINRSVRDLTEEEMDEFLNGISINSTSNRRRRYLNDYKNSQNYYPARNNNHLLYQAWDKMYEIPMAEIQIGEELNRGGFGIINKAKLTRKDKFDGIAITTEVAVKTPLGEMDVDKFKNLLREIKLSSHVGSHDCVVKFLGACTQDIKRLKVFLVVELCENGDLLSFLKGLNKQEILAVYNSGNGNLTCSPVCCSRRNQFNFELSILLKWSRQIASGMAHLARRNVIHGDLAARNVLLNKTFDAKISDFGLSRELNNTGIYIIASRELLPWRWLSPESLQNVFTNKSDVWSYGVTLWEIFTLGDIPYGNVSNGFNFIFKLQNGTILPQPDLASQEIYDVMLNTWKHDPAERFTFEELERILINLQCNSSV